MNSGKIGMLVTGPWDLSSAPRHRLRRAGDADVRRFGGGPSDDRRARTTGWCSTTATRRKQAAIDFVKWLTAPEQVKAFSLATGDLPIRESVGAGSGRSSTSSTRTCPAQRAFVENLANVKKVRPTGRAVPRDLRGAGPGDRVRHARQGAAGRRARTRPPRPRTRRWPRSRPESEHPETRPAGSVAGAAPRPLGQRDGLGAGEPGGGPDRRSSACCRC